jgi:hypothetical protein
VAQSLLESWIEINPSVTSTFDEMQSLRESILQIDGEWPSFGLRDALQG